MSFALGSGDAFLSLCWSLALLVTTGNVDMKPELYYKVKSYCFIVEKNRVNFEKQG